MGISLKPEHLKRYKDIAWLLLKYGRSAGAESVPGEPDPAEIEDAKALADDLEKMGPTFIKLGQLLSTRADLLPLPYLDALARLQDHCEPFSFAEVEQVVQSELGVRISKAFSEFDPEPIAAASLGQVHRARMRNGKEVAVKVQRPNVREQIVEDFEALSEAAGFIDSHTEVGRHYEFAKVLDEFRRSLLRELDYRQEAANLEKLREMLVEFDRIVVPAPVNDYSTGRVLTMDYVRGTKITSLSPLVRTETDCAALVDELFRAYLRQTLVEGFFHADPHPGNVFLTKDGRIALLDLGMTAHITPALQERLLQLLLAVAEGRAEEAATFAIRIGVKREHFDEPEFRRRIGDLVARQRNATAEQLDVGRTVVELARISVQCGIRIPSELTMLGKTLFHLDEVSRVLDPTFDPNAAIRKHAADVLQRRLKQSLSRGQIFSAMLETKEFFEALPGRVNRILDRVAQNEVEVKVNAIDEVHLMTGLQKIANRITLGLVLAALIVGAALLMAVPTDWRIFGYPGLAILFFLGAAGGGVVLMYHILFRDERERPKK